MEKRKIPAILLCMIIFLHSVGAFGDEIQKGFSKGHLDSIDQEAIEMKEILFDSSRFYGLTNDSQIYVWTPGEEELSQYSQLPPLPAEGKIMPYAKLTQTSKKEMGEVVTHLYAGDDKLWGFNIYSGKIGEIESNGIQWQELMVNNEIMMNMANDLSQLRLPGFVENGSLCLLMNNTILTFNMATGAQKEYDTQNNILDFIQYKQGKALLTAFTEEDQSAYHQGLLTFNLDTGEMEKLNILRPAIEQEDESESIDITAVAYDKKADSIYFKAEGLHIKENGMLYKSIRSEPFKPIGKVNHLGGRAFAFNENQYSLWRQDDGVYIYNTDTLKLEKQVELLLKGPAIFGSSQAMNRYMQMHPETNITNLIKNIESEDVLSLLSGDDQIDGYIMFANQLFKAIREKGYGLNLITSEGLKQSIEKMNPAVQKVVTNEQSQIIGYPVGMSIGLWVANQSLWKNFFGDRAYPTTYVELFELMEEWDEKYAAENEALNIYGSALDYLLGEMVLRYIIEYERPDQPLNFDTPVFREAMTAFNKMYKTIDKERFMQNDEVEGAEAFILGGEVNIHNNQYLFSTKDKELTLVAPMNFEKDKKAAIRADLIVLFINQKSKNAQQALDYLEYMAQKENIDPVLFHALMADVEKPYENPEYIKQLKGLKEKKAALEQEKQKEEETDSSYVCEQISEIDQKISQVEENRWIISLEGMERYQQWLEQIRFSVESIYISQNDTQQPFLEKVEQLSTQYIHGEIKGNQFISALNQQSQMIYSESQ